jgi:hypothetical protein
MHHQIKFTRGRTAFGPYFSRFEFRNIEVFFGLKADLERIAILSAWKLPQGARGRSI